MKTKILTFSLAVFISYGIAWAQIPTSYGNLNQGNAGNDGNQTNSYFGNSAGINNTGSQNTFIGHQSGLSNSDGLLNTFIGYNSGISNTSGFANTFVGGASGGAHIDGERNTFIGRQSGHDHLTGNYNVFLGERSGYLNQIGSGNVFLGREAGFNEMGSNKLYIDNSNETSPLIWGDFSTNALRFHGTVRITEIYENVANDFNHVLVEDTDGDIFWRDADGIGTDDQQLNLIGNQLQLEDGGNVDLSSYLDNTDNQDLTYDELTQTLSISNGNDVVLSGLGGVDNLGDHQVLQDLLPDVDNAYNLGGNGNAFSNIYFDNSLFINDTEFLHTRDNNVAMGTAALVSVAGGSQNVAVGENALEDNTTGANNTAIGTGTMSNNLTGSNNTAIGYNAHVQYSHATNSTAIGNGAIAFGSNQVRIGNSSVGSIGGYEPWSHLSDGRFKKNIRENIPGLEFIAKLRPVSYEIDQAKLQAFLGEETATNSPNKQAIGFVAQEVEQVVKENNYVFTGVEKPQNEKDHYSIRYAEFVVPLVKAVQEQQEIIESLQQEVSELKSLLYGDSKTNNSTAKASGATNTTAKGGFALRQNIPNPFDKTTTISAMVPETVRQAKIAIYNLNGLELESYDLNKRGHVAVEISGGVLPSGMYLYALIADGQIIDTKKMILTK